MNNCSENHSVENYTVQNCSSNVTYASRSGEVLAFVSAWNLFVFILTQLFGGAILLCVYHNKKLRDPVAVLMALVTVLLMILSVPLNLLVDISVLADFPLIRDSSIGNVIITYLMVFRWFSIAVSVGLIATVQFLTIKYGRKRVTTHKVLPVYAALLFLIILYCIVVTVIVFTRNGNKTQGFLATEAIIYGLIAFTLEYVIPLVVTLVMSFMSYRTVKNSVVEMDTDFSVIKSVIVMSSTTILTAFISKIPFLAFTVWLVNTGNPVAFVMSSLLSSLEPLITLLLFTLIHQTIRLTLMKFIRTITTISDAASSH